MTLNWWLDKISGTIELALFMPFVMDMRHIVRVRTSISINVRSQWAYFAYCAWGGVYFAALEQWFAAASAVVWCAGYVVKLIIVFRFRPLLVEEPEG